MLYIPCIEFVLYDFWLPSKNKLKNQINSVIQNTLLPNMQSIQITSGFPALPSTFNPTRDPAEYREFINSAQNWQDFLAEADADVVKSALPEVPENWEEQVEAILHPKEVTSAVIKQLAQVINNEKADEIKDNILLNSLITVHGMKPLDALYKVSEGEVTLSAALGAYAGYAAKSLKDKERATVSRGKENVRTYNKNKFKAMIDRPVKGSSIKKGVVAILTHEETTRLNVERRKRNLEAKAKRPPPQVVPRSEFVTPVEMSDEEDEESGPVFGPITEVEHNTLEQALQLERDLAEARTQVAANSQKWASLSKKLGDGIPKPAPCAPREPVVPKVKKTKKVKEVNEDEEFVAQMMGIKVSLAPVIAPKQVKQPVVPISSPKAEEEGFVKVAKKVKPPPTPVPLKTRMCQYIEGGKGCRNGKKCTFAHSASELVVHHRSQREERPKTQACRHIAEGKTCKVPRGTCYFAHTPAELSIRECKFGEECCLPLARCRFLHQDDYTKTRPMRSVLQGAAVSWRG